MDLPGGDQRVDCDGLLEVAVQQVEVVEVEVTLVVVLVMEEEEEEVVVVEVVDGVGQERMKRSVAEVERTPAGEVAGWEGEE